LQNNGNIALLNNTNDLDEGENIDKIPDNNNRNGGDCHDNLEGMVMIM